MTAFYIGQHEIADEGAFAAYLKETMPLIERHGGGYLTKAGTHEMLEGRRPSRVVVVEFAPNDDRVSPRIPALFALAMLANNMGDAYTVSEHRTMLSHAGFSDCEVQTLLPTAFTAITARKA